MLRVNFAIGIAGPDGEEIRTQEITEADGSITLGKEVLLSETIANIIYNSRAKVDAGRLFNLAMEMWKSKGPMDIDDQDVDAINVVLDAAGVTIAVKGCVALAIEKARDEAARANDTTTKPPLKKQAPKKKKL